MLNLWKRIQEKKRIGSPKKNIDIPILSPQYDGPLRFFDYDDSDIVPLEECRLSLNDMHAINENRCASMYFKSFLESRMVSEVLLMYDLIQNKDSNLNSRSSTQESPGSSCVPSLFRRLMSRLPEDIKTKLLHSDKFTRTPPYDTDLDGLKSLLFEVLFDYWSEFLQSEWYFRYQLNLLTSRSITLGDIMHHETALSYFMQFLEMEGCSNVIEFWLKATNFKQFLQSSAGDVQMNVNQIMNDAMNIYEKYLSLLATCPLGFNDSVRCAVEEAICDEAGGLPQADSFELAVNVVLAFLRKTYLYPFLSSQHYVRMLSDLICHSSAFLNRSPTSSVSEYSTDSKKELPLKFDPDSVWRRRKRSGLSFGRVDELGRFQSDIEPDPDRSSESKVSKIMKKWVQRNANRIEEEMAWQVAEMVIKDITGLTLGSHLDNFETDNCAAKIE